MTKRPRFTLWQLLVAVALLGVLLGAGRWGWDYWGLESARRRNIRALVSDLQRGKVLNLARDGWTQSLAILERSKPRELRQPQIASVGVAERESGRLTLMVYWVQWPSEVTGFVFSAPGSQREFELRIDDPELLAELADWSRSTPAISHVEQLSPTGGLGQLLLDSARSGRPVRVTPICDGERVNTAQRELPVVLWDKD